MTAITDAFGVLMSGHEHPLWGERLEQAEVTRARLVDASENSVHDAQRSPALDPQRRCTRGGDQPPVVLDSSGLESPDGCCPDGNHAPRMVPGLLYSLDGAFWDLEVLGEGEERVD